MMQLVQSLQSWGKEDFAEVCKLEIAQHAKHLPLQQNLASGNCVLDAPVTVMINRVTEMKDVLFIRTGIFYLSVIAGCSCADDPTTASEINEYCEVRLEINKVSGEARFV